MKDQWMPLLDQAVIALLNGVLQGLLLTVFVWLMLRIFRKINASTRYLIWMGTLGCLAAFPLIHFLLAKVGTGQDVQSVKNERSVPAQSITTTNTIQEPLSVTGLEIAQIEPSIQGDWEINLEHEHPFFDQEHAKESEEQELIFNEVAEEVASIEAELSDSITSGVTSFYSGAVSSQDVKSSNDASVQDEVTSITTFPLARFFRAAKNLTIATRLPQWPVLTVMGLFILGAIWNALKLTYDLWLLSRLKKEAVLPSAELMELFHAVTSIKGMRSGIALKVHPKLKTPLAAGFYQPLILMPEALANALNDSAKEQILKHELAHLLRYDDWTNLYQRLIQAFYFFHPAVWLVSRRADIEREIACDDHVLDRAGQAKSYALMLTQFANRERDRHLASASAVWNKQSQIKERIEMLLDHHRNTAPRPARLSTGLLTTAALIVAALTLQYGPRVALADDPAASSSDTPAAASGSSNSIFENEVEEPRSKDESNPLSSLLEAQDSAQVENNSNLTSPEDVAGSGSGLSRAQNNSSNDNPYRRSSSLNHKPVLARESTANSSANDAFRSRTEAPNRSNRRSGRAVRSPRLRPVPGTARVEVIDQAHSHPVEVEIISEPIFDHPNAQPAVTVRSRTANPLERRIAKLENLVERLLKNVGSNEPKSSQLSRRSTSSRRSMNAPASDFAHGGSASLFGHVPGANAELPTPAQFQELAELPEPKPIAPSFDGFEELSHEVAQRAHELERKAQFGALVRKEVEQKRKQLHMQMLRLKQEMAELESEMKALETQAKKRKIRQTFGGGVHQDAFSSDAIAEDFGDAFDSFGGDDASSIK